MKNPKENGANGVEKSSTNPDLAVPSLAQTLLGHAPDIDRLKSALSSTHPSNDLKVIAYHYIAPITRAAGEFPEVEEQLKALTSQWACGELTLPLFTALHRLPIMRTSCLAAGPRSSVARTSSG